VHPSPSGLPRFLLLTALFLFLAGCSPDLRESVGPRVPVPNLTGQVLRAGVPVADIKVKLEEAVSESLVADERTGPDGRYGFTAVGSGNWLLRVDPREAGDFDRLIWEFHHGGNDSTLQAPPLDVGLRGTRVIEPVDSAVTDVPSFRPALTFRWENPRSDSCTVQVRVADSTGLTIWTSEKLDTDSTSWNGRIKYGPQTNLPVGPGVFDWKLRVRDAMGIEYDTARFTITFRSEP